MLKTIALLLIIIFSIFSIMLGSASSENLQRLVDQYYSNKSQLTNLNLNITYLEGNARDLNKSLIKLEQQIKNIDENNNIISSELAILDKTIQENKNKKIETERSIHLINTLNNKESILLIGTLIGMIAGLWIVSLALVFFWRR